MKFKLDPFAFPGAWPIVYVDLLGSTLCALCAEDEDEVVAYPWRQHLEQCPFCLQCLQPIDMYERLLSVTQEAP